MNLHAQDKTQHPENVELLSAQKPITDFKGLLTTIISAVVCFGIYHILPYSPDANKGIALLIFAAARWFTEAVHITATALMLPILAVVLGFPTWTSKRRWLIFPTRLSTFFSEASRLPPPCICSGWTVESPSPCCAYRVTIRK